MSLGIHHVTAIATDPQRNLDFYVGVLGLRLVKRTVNFDDPSAYHFYYGDALGRPGTDSRFESKDAWTVDSLHQQLGPHFEKLEPVTDGFVVPPS